MKYLFIGITLALVMGCGKSVNNNVNPDSTTILSDGTLSYGSKVVGSMKVVNLNFSQGPFPIQNIQSAFALFFNSMQLPQNAGIVSCNDSTLSFSASPFTLYSYNGFNLFSVDSNNITWKVQGNSFNSIPPFVYIHNEPLPKTFDFTATTISVDLNKNFTINFPALPSNVTGIVFNISGDNGDKGYGFMGNTRTSMTFSSADLKSVMKNGNIISVSAAPQIITTAIIAGKQYNFIKSFQVAKYFNVQ